jgi:hypothetical protein
MVLTVESRTLILRLTLTKIYLIILKDSARNSQ